MKQYHLLDVLVIHLLIQNLLKAGSFAQFKIESVYFEQLLRNNIPKRSIFSFGAVIGHLENGERHHGNIENNAHKCIV